MHAQALQTWIKAYDTAPIDTQSRPSQALIDSLKEPDYVVTSSLNRAQDSALVLGLFIDEKSAIFDELAIPHIDIGFFKFRPKTWLTLLRLSMFFQSKSKSPAWIDANKRADKAASYLTHLSTYHDSIVLLGHGGMHYLTQKALQENGWKIEGKASYKNWGTIRLIYKKSA